MSDVQILSQRKSGAVLIESRHEEGQTDKQRLHQRKSSDGVLTTYTRYVLLRAASEEFWGGVKHDLAYELWGRLAAEFWAFLPAVETYQMVTPVTTVRYYDWLMYQMQRLFSSGFFSSERFFFFWVRIPAQNMGPRKGKFLSFVQVCMAVFCLTPGFIRENFRQLLVLRTADLNLCVRRTPLQVSQRKLTENLNLFVHTAWQTAIKKQTKKAGKINHYRHGTVFRRYLCHTLFLIC